MQIYGKAIKDAGPHPEALGYYLNDPRPCHALEGNLKTNLAKIIIRFLPDCAATRFWHTKAYQDYSKPLGKNRQPGDYHATLLHHREFEMTSKMGASSSIQPISDSYRQGS